jgi:hypothetical protein
VALDKKGWRRAWFDAGEPARLVMGVCGMSGRFTVGTRVTTLVELPVVNSVDDPGAPVGTEGIVRRVFGDALGGYQVELFVNDTAVSAVAYGSQLSLVRPG